MTFLSNRQPSATPTPSTAHKTGKTRRYQRVFSIFILAMSVLVILYFNRITVLQLLGGGLIYQDQPEPCDAVILLGGGGPLRAERAVQLFHAGYADKLLITLIQAPDRDILDRDIINMESLLIQSLLYENQIDPPQVFWSPIPFYSTFREAQYVRYWLETRGYDSAVIVTGLFQSRRAKWTFDFFMEGSGIQFYIVPAEGKYYSAEHWWKHIEGIISVENEWLKLIYYAFRLTLSSPEPYSSPA